ncbi:hypothetical protein K9U40_13955 [Xanthobacter autotrophicus]|uniref:hypothetical protein n=1 Tax=Xanthobacter TaxID=279 RepID=UPI0024AA1FC5|nr:hypothetical protein [Xanthobacter autotrophicus]MDI4665425.1 hypothetical protein [Xanthobacter autotrophicus]
MTITINVPVFPLRKEIAARKRRLNLSLCLPGRGAKGGAKGAGNGPDPRYTADGLEFDVSDIGKPGRRGEG